MSGPKLLPEIGTGLKGVSKNDRLSSYDQPRKESSFTGEFNAKKQEIASSPGKVGASKVLKLRNNVIKDIKNGTVDESKIMNEIQNAGISDPNAIEAILSPKLNDNIIMYFLNVTKNNTKQAKILAKKFGFEV